LERQNSNRIQRIEDLPSIWGVQAELSWLVEGAIPLGTVNLLSAESGTGKSWVAYGLAGCVAKGEPFAGLPVQQRPVVYFDGENPAAVVKERLGLLGINETPGLRVWGGWVEDSPPGPDDPRVIQFAQEQQALLIWDSLVEFNPGDEMNATDTRKFMKHFRALANLGATVLILHHSGKTATSQEYRGSSDIKAGVDTAYVLETVQQQDGGIYRLKMRSFKSRVAPGQSFGLEFRNGEGFSKFEPAGKLLKPNAPALLMKILEDDGEMNGTALKQIAKEKYGISKGAVETFLKNWPHRRRGGKGNQILYTRLLPIAA
jgi:hypothetical protein